MAGGYKKLWTTVIETPSFSPPLVSARLVLVEGGAALVGLDPASGAQRWTIPFGSPQRRLAWSLLTPDGPIFCAGKEDLWRITAVDNDGQKRWTGLVEAVRTTAVAIGGKLWVLADGESSCIRLFSEQGEMEGMWEVPKGGGGLVAEEGALLFLVQNSEEDSLFRFTTVDKKIQRIYAGELDSVLSIDGYRLLRGKAQSFVVTDREGRELWRQDSSNELPYLGEQVYCCVETEAGWAPSALDRSNGQPLWSLEREEAAAWSHVVPLGDHVALYDNSDVEIVDRTTGTSIQTITCEYHNFTGVGPGCCTDGLLVMAEQANIHAYVWKP